MNKIKIYKQGDIAYVAYFVKTGSRSEQRETKGVSHFLEHMLFKGTKTRTCKQILYEIERYGATLNAFTDFEGTFYYAKVHKKYLNKVKTVLRDMLQNSIFPKKELQRERGVIIQEIKMYKDSNEAALWHAVNQQLYSTASGLHDSIAGTEETFNNITNNFLINWYKYYYKDITELLITDKNISKSIYFSKSKSFEPEKVNLQKQPSHFIVRKDIEQTKMVLSGVINLPVTYSNRFLLQLYTAILNDMSGRLFQVVREKYGLAYTVYFYAEPFSCGTVQWNVYAGINKKNINKVKELVITELTKPILEKEKKYAIDKLIGQTSLRLNNIGSIGRVAFYCALHNLNYFEFLDHYAINIRRASKSINEFASSIDFNKYQLVALVPDK